MADILGDESFLSELKKKLKGLKNYERPRCGELCYVFTVVALFLALVAAVVYAAKLYIKNRDAYDGFALDDDEEDEEDPDDAPDDDADAQ